LGNERFLELPLGSCLGCNNGKYGTVRGIGLPIGMSIVIAVVLEWIPKPKMKGDKLALEIFLIISTRGI